MLQSKKYHIAGFLLLAVAQWLLPTQMIWQEEQVAFKGQTFKFKTQPIDPNDPFRGKYITLRFEASTFTTANNGSPKWMRNDKVYALLEKDAEGFVTIKTLLKKAPTDQSDYIQTNISRINADGDSSHIILDLPFTRFYMEERKAPKAEKVYRAASANEKEDAYAIVKVFEGKAALQDVVVGGVSIKKLVE